MSSKTLLSELKDAVSRISDLVAAVRSYSQMDRASAQRVDVRDGLESTVTMLGHKLKGGVDVVREYADLPEIDAYAGELNQVWTNLIDNAVDAMDGQGTLTLRTRAEGDWVIVEIADTGGGMPPEVVARAFEPFFTTKDVGRGTGLGLDIARRIVVERHGGPDRHRLPRPRGRQGHRDAGEPAAQAPHLIAESAQSDVEKSPSRRKWTLKSRRVVIRRLGVSAADRRRGWASAARRRAARRPSRAVLVPVGVLATGVAEVLDELLDRCVVRIGGHLGELRLGLQHGVRPDAAGVDLSAAQGSRRRLWYFAVGA